MSIGFWASLVTQLVKNPPVMQETWVWSLDWEDPPGKGKATHSSVLAWRIPVRGEPGRLPSMGSHRVASGGQSIGVSATTSVLP